MMSTQKSCDDGALEKIDAMQLDDYRRVEWSVCELAAEPQSRHVAAVVCSKRQDAADKERIWERIWERI
jgi:hypothetical protein